MLGVIGIPLVMCGERGLTENTWDGGSEIVPGGRLESVLAGPACAFVRSPEVFAKPGLLLLVTAVCVRE